MNRGLATLGKRHRDAMGEAAAELDQEFDGAAHRDKRQRSAFRPMYELLCGFVDRTEAEGGATCEGDKRLAELRRILDSFNWARSPDQFRFHEDFIKLCLPHIFGLADFEQNRMRLMQAFQLDCFKVGALVLTPRRWGKTTAVSMFIAAMLLICDGVKIATFAPGQRASTMLRDKVERLLHEPLINGGGRIVESKATQISVAVPDMVTSNGELRMSARTIAAADRVNTLWAYPANPKGKTMPSLTPNRGSGVFWPTPLPVGRFPLL
jgi:hypothetical protein